jgi:hypothetical protein
MKINHELVRIKNLHEIWKYQDLLKEKKQTALDFNALTGELRARFTVSKTGNEGNGAPPAPQSDKWVRVTTC